MGFYGKNLPCIHNYSKLPNDRRFAPENKSLAFLSWDLTELCSWKNSFPGFQKGQFDPTFG
jgi:hypothetical protein